MNDAELATKVTEYLVKHPIRRTAGGLAQVLGVPEDAMHRALWLALCCKQVRRLGSREWEANLQPALPLVGLTR